MKHKAALVTLALLAAPLAAGAQAKGKPVRLGLLYGGSPAFNPESDPSTEPSCKRCGRTVTSWVSTL
jgi:hypothetical protein